MTFITEHKYIVLDIRDGFPRAKEHKVCDTLEDATAEIERVMKIHDGPNWRFTIVKTWELKCVR